jgi:ADP-ribose pyrophosphatase
MERDQMGYELLDRDYRYRGRVFDVSVSRFRSPAKGDVAIEIVHHNGGAGAIPLFADGTIALVRQWRYPLGRYSLEIAAGRIEAGQTAEETAARELEEELGWKARKLDKLCEFFIAPGYCEEKISVFLATDLELSEQKLDDDEEIEVVRIGFDAALARVRSGEIDDAKSILGLMRAEALVRAMRP